MESSISFYRGMRRSKERKDLLSSINTVNASWPLRGSMEKFTDISFVLIVLYEVLSLLEAFVDFKALCHLCNNSVWLGITVRLY